MPVSVPAVLAEDLAKKFNRSLAGAAWLGLKDGLRRSLGLKARAELAPGEFWALRDISFRLERGECLGVIGPNGAGKTTLLKLINRELRPDRGRIATAARAKSLIRIGSGLQPMLSGRENIYIQCAQLGLSKPQTDTQLERIVEFAGLKEAIDAPVKTYSDGMYARLEFAAATCVPMELLLIDEVLAVGDIAFQLRCLEHLDRLKRAGTAVVLVSHSEMNIRQVADRCLLLFDGRQLAVGEPERLFAHYYTAVGYRNQPLKAAGASVAPPQERADGIAVTGLARSDGEGAARVGGVLELVLSYRAERHLDDLAVLLHFWTAGGLLLASVDSAYGGQTFTASGTGTLRLKLPFLGMAPGLYRVAAGLRQGDRLLAYRCGLLQLAVADGGRTEPAGLAVLPVAVEAAGGG